MPTIAVALAAMTGIGSTRRVGLGGRTPGSVTRRDDTPRGRATIAPHEPGRRARRRAARPVLGVDRVVLRARAPEDHGRAGPPPGRTRARVDRRARRRDLRHPERPRAAA